MYILKVDIFLHSIIYYTISQNSNSYEKILENRKRFKINYCKILTDIVKYSHEMIPEKEEAYKQYYFIREISVMPDHRQRKNWHGISSLAQRAGRIPGSEGGR